MSPPIDSVDRSATAADLVVDEATFVVTMGPEREILEGASVAVVDGRIEAVAPAAELRDRWVSESTRVIDASGSMLSPGLVNAHTHLESCFDKGLMGGVPVLPFVDRYFAFTYGTLDPETYRDAALVNLLGCLKTGTTTVADCGTLPGMEDHAVEAVEQIGARAVLARCLMDVHDDPADPSLELGGEVARESTEECLKRSREFLERFAGTAARRVRPALDLQALTNCSPRLCREAAELARSAGVGLHSHVAWSHDTVELARRRTGYRDVEYLDAAGALGPNVVAAHAIHLTARELVMLRDSGASVVHVPGSSQFFAQGALAPASRFPDYASLGINIALGNDELSTGTSHDLMRDVWLVSRAHAEARQARTQPDRDLFAAAPHDPSPPPVEMATRNGAAALGLDDEIGSIEVGKRADLVLWDLSSYEWLPTVRETLIPNWVENGTGRSVDTVVCDGQVVLDGGRSTLIDEEALAERVQATAARITPTAPWIERKERWTLMWSAAPADDPDPERSEDGDVRND